MTSKMQELLYDLSDELEQIMYDTEDEMANGNPDDKKTAYLYGKRNGIAMAMNVVRGYLAKEKEVRQE